jgi:hypothetical protein
MGVPGRFGQRWFPKIAVDLKLPKAPETAALQLMRDMRMAQAIERRRLAVPPTLVADAHDTSVKEIEHTYAKYIADASGNMLRDTLIPIEFAVDRAKVIPLKRK